MKEYTVLSVIALLLTLLLDRMSSIKLLRRREFYVFLLTIMFFKVLVNGYLTSRLIVIYNPRFFLNMRLGSIPLEDFLFGFSMVTMTLLFWEYFKKAFSGGTR